MVKLNRLLSVTAKQEDPGKGDTWNLPRRGSLHLREEVFLFQNEKLSKCKAIHELLFAKFKANMLAGDIENLVKSLNWQDNLGHRLNSTIARRALSIETYDTLRSCVFSSPFSANE